MILYKNVPNSTFPISCLIFSALRSHQKEVLFHFSKGLSIFYVDGQGGGGGFPKIYDFLQGGRGGLSKCLCRFKHYY